MWFFCSWVHCLFVCLIDFFSYAETVDIAFMQQWTLFNASNEKEVCSFFFKKKEVIQNAWHDIIPISQYFTPAYGQ